MADHPAIGDVRGMGLMFGVEFVQDRSTRTPDPLVAAYVMQRMKSLGVLVSTDGPNRNVVKMKPPLCFSEDDGES
jgi:4-aminobutyrate aminotransferase-like enzyme